MYTAAVSSAQNDTRLPPTEIWPKAIVKVLLKIAVGSPVIAVSGAVIPPTPVFAYEIHLPPFVGAFQMGSGHALMRTFVPVILFDSDRPSPERIGMVAALAELEPNPSPSSAQRRTQFSFFLNVFPIRPR